MKVVSVWTMILSEIWYEESLGHGFYILATGKEIVEVVLECLCREALRCVEKLISIFSAAARSLLRWNHPLTHACVWRCHWFRLYFSGWQWTFTQDLCFWGASKKRGYICRMDWSASSPNLNPTEHVWDALGRRLAARSYLLENTRWLKQMFIK